MKYKLLKDWISRSGEQYIAGSICEPDQGGFAFEKDLRGNGAGVHPLLTKEFIFHSAWFEPVDEKKWEVSVAEYDCLKCQSIKTYKMEETEHLNALATILEAVLNRGKFNLTGIAAPEYSRIYIDDLTSGELEAFRYMAEK